MVKALQWLLTHSRHAKLLAVKRVTSNKGKKHLLQVVRICSIGIRRHIKIKADANPYLPEFAGYFRRRRNNKEARLPGALSARAYRAMKAQEV